MARSLYLINPKGESPSYFGAEVYELWGFQPTQGIADLALPTVAAMAPSDFEIELCDEYVQPVDFDTDAEVVGLTGKITQASRMSALAHEFRRRGKTVLIGGPYASLSPEAVRDSCDILVRGEMEEIAEEVFSDILRNRAQEEYEGTRPDLALSPLPRWDLYPNDRTLLGCVQTSRGCPFQCEFCDVIQYLGRNQRHKPVENILAELDQLYRIGYRAVFLADDNFTVYRQRAKEVLAALADWNRDRPDGPMAFGTQVSIDAARDDELLDLCADAGMTWVFIGIETPNEESLKETRKRQNVGVDLPSQIQRFLDRGISVTGGMIVGFDADGPDIFQRQYEFAMSVPVPMFSIGALVAPAATPLFDRMEKSGRLVQGGSEVAAAPWDTNILPVQMTRDELFEGLRSLCNHLYSPADFGERVVRMIESLGPPRGPFENSTGETRRDPRPVGRDGFNLIRRLIRKGSEERKMWARIQKALDRRPETSLWVLDVLARYAQVRAMYDAGSFWEPELTDRPLGATMPTDGGKNPEGLVSLGS